MGFAQRIDSVEFENHYKLAVKSYKNSEFKRAIENWNYASKFTNSNYNKARCNLNIATCYKRLSKYDSAFYYYGRVQEILGSVDSVKLLGRLYNNLGTLCLETGAYVKAEEYLLQALKFKKEADDSSSIGSTLLNLGEVQLRLDNWEEAEDYYQQSLAIRKLVNDTFGIASCYINLGILEKKRGQYGKALSYYDDVLNLCNNGLNNNVEVIKLLTYENMGSLFVNERKIEEAFNSYNIALNISQKIGSQTDIAHCKNEIAHLKINQGIFRPAQILALEAFAIADSFNILESLQNYSMTVSAAYAGLGNYKKAYKWLKKHETYKDSILTIEKISEIQGMEYIYQSQQKENQILKLSNENIQQEAQLTQAKFTSYGIFGVLLLILGLGYILWFRQKQKQKLALLKSTVTASEAEKNRLGRELHDGIAGRILKIVYDTENNQTELSNTLLEIYNQVRHLSHQLDGTPVHGELFFDRLLEVIPEDNEKQTFNLTLLPNNMILQEPVGSSVYRIIQELITNNLKYAKANKTDIKIVVNDNRLVINYSDNGIGTDNFNKGNGFHNIEDRVTLLKGSVIINTHSTKGFQVEIIIPYTFDANEQ